MNYTGIKNLTLSASGYFGNSGQGNEFIFNDEQTSLDATIQLGTAYAKYDWKNFRFVTVGTYGKLSDTEKIFAQTAFTQGEGQVLGNEVYGYLFEAGCNILPYLRKEHSSKPKKTKLWNSEELKLSLFARYERLNTHHVLAPSLSLLPRVEKNLSVLTAGINFNSRENIVLKANYRYAYNRFLGDPQQNKHIVEFGLGFIF